MNNAPAFLVRVITCTRDRNPLTATEHINAERVNLARDFLGEVFEVIVSDFRGTPLSGGRGAQAQRRYGTAMLVLIGEGIEAHLYSDYPHAILKAAEGVWKVCHSRLTILHPPFPVVEGYCDSDFQCDLLSAIDEREKTLLGVCLPCFLQGEDDFMKPEKCRKHE